MPIYEYECSDCGQRIERIQGRDDPPPECECGGTMERQISAPAFQFKGTGWYVTDYADRKPSGEGDSSGSSGKSESGKESSDSSKSKGGKSSSEGSDKASASKPSAAGNAG